MSIGILGIGVRVLRPGHYSERSPNESGEEHGESDRASHNGNDKGNDSERVFSPNDEERSSSSSSSDKGEALSRLMGQEPGRFMYESHAIMIMTGEE